MITAALPLHLETALDVGAEYLEQASPWADRYSIPGEESTYFCRDCGLEIEDADEGCEHCGFGREEDQED